VKAAADYRQVSDRTARRWRERLEATGEDALAFLSLDRCCPVCGKQLPETRRISRIYCPGSRCRVKAFRERKR
jgi:DNA repair exonuclease SbcCD ATPase subunit